MIGRWPVEGDGSAAVAARGGFGGVTSYTKVKYKTGKRERNRRKGVVMVRRSDSKEGAKSLTKKGESSLK